MDLIPGTWYSLMMKARNDAGTTEAEYVFATLTTNGGIYYIYHFHEYFFESDVRKKFAEYSYI